VTRSAGIESRSESRYEAIHECQVKGAHLKAAATKSKAIGSAERQSRDWRYQGRRCVQLHSQEWLCHIGAALGRELRAIYLLA
jgi:hypothetical protein